MPDPKCNMTISDPIELDEVDIIAAGGFEHTGTEWGMGDTTRLGEFELMVMLAVLHRRDDAYGVTIADELEERSGRSTSRGALYVTLKRLEEKGFLTSRLDRAHEQRGGRRRRYYRPTPDGVAAVGEAREAMRRMWSGLEQELGA